MVARLLVLAVLALSAGCATEAPTAPEPTAGVEPIALSAELTQDSRDTAAGRIAVILTNTGAQPVTPDAISLLDPRLAEPLTAQRLRAIPAGGERRFPLPLTEPVCDPMPGEAARVAVRVGAAEVVVSSRDEVGVVDRWVARRCAELGVAAVAPLAFSEVRPVGSAALDLVLTATPAGQGSGAYVIESVAGTPVFTSTGGPWMPGATVSADGARVDIALSARPARCDGHVFGESAGATAFLVGVRLDGERLEVLVRMPPELASTALDLAVQACRTAPP